MYITLLIIANKSLWFYGRSFLLPDNLELSAYLPRSFAKKILHPSGHMAILSLPCGYELKDVSGIFQPRFISFGAERKIVRLRLKNHSAENFLPLSAMKES